MESTSRMGEAGPRPRRSRGWVVTSIVAAAGVLAAWGGVPGVNNSLAVWFVEDDPARVAYERFQERFGNDEVVVLAVGSPGVRLEGSGLDRIGRVAERMREVDGIASVLGPAELDARPEPLRALLMSERGDVALVVARFELMADADARRHDILVALRAAAGELEAAGDEVRWAGIGLVYDELNEASFRETPALTLLSFGIVALLLFGLTRSVGSVVLALSSVILSVTILFGIFAVLGNELNMITAILPTLVLVLGTATAVHIFHRFQTGLDHTADQVLRRVFRPCLFTALTTAAGFVALAAARMAVVRDLGIYAALGVIITLVVSFGLAWALLPLPWFQPKGRLGPDMKPAFRRLARGVTRNRGRIVAASLVVAAVSLWSASRLQVDTYSIEFFKEGNRVRVDSEAIEGSYGWYLPLEVEVETGRSGGAFEAETLRQVAEWRTLVKEAGLAQWSLSLADFVAAASEEAGGGAVPGAPAEAQGGAFPGAPAGADGATGPSGPGTRLVDEDGSALRVSFGVPMASAREWEGRIDRILAEADGVVGPSHELRPGGYLPLYVRMMEYIVDTQVRSFAVSFVLVFLVMGLFLRSLRLAAVAFLPNLLPIAATFGVMGALGIRLDIATVTIAAIVLGIVVDDTVHLLHSFRETLRETGNPDQAVEEALVRVGPALSGTTVILVFSFAALGFAGVNSIALFGTLTAMTIAFALAADLVLMPVCLLLATGPGSARSRIPTARAG